MCRHFFPVSTHYCPPFQISFAMSSTINYRVSWGTRTEPSQVHLITLVFNFVPNTVTVVVFLGVMSNSSIAVAIVSYCSSRSYCPNHWWVQCISQWAIVFLALASLWSVYRTGSTRPKLQLCLESQVDRGIWFQKCVSVYINSHMWAQ